MNKQRAQEIIDSQTMIRVTHNGVPVYLQKVNETTETARVYPLGAPDDELDIALDALHEE